jgi:hypothetical protein
MNGDTEDLQKSLARLTGQNWFKTSKLDSSSSASDPASDEDDFDPYDD